MTRDNNTQPQTGHTETDVVVLGVGTSGEDLSLQLLDAGLDVVGIEASLVGGECPYWACLPSKMMIRAAHALQEARRVDELAGEADVRPDWSPVATRVRQATGEWDDTGGVERYQNRGGRLIRGRGKLVGPGTVAVGDETIKARRGVVIATGSKPIIPPLPGLEDVDYWTTHDMIEAPRLPRSIIIIGGGVVGCELGQMLARFGVDVTIVEANERLLAHEAPESSAAIEEVFESEGITVYTGSPAQHVDSPNGSIRVTIEGGIQTTGERLLVATGRTVDVSDLDLESAGIDSSTDSLEVDERMRVDDGIWAMGDVTGAPMFTHLGLYQSAIVAADILGKDHPPADYRAIPRVAFTDPQMAAVGMTEAQATEAGRKVVAVRKQLPSTFSGWVHATPGGLVKLIVDSDSTALVGASIVGPHAGDMLGLLTLAINEQIPLRRLRSMIYAFPALHGAIGEALGAYGRGVTTVMDPEYRGVSELDDLEEKPSR